MVKNPPASAGDLRDVASMPGPGRFPGERYGNPLQWSCLENHMHRGPWQATVQRVVKSWTRLKRLSMQHIFYIWNLKHDANEPIYEAEVDSQTQKTNFVATRGERG